MGVNKKIIAEELSHRREQKQLEAEQLTILANLKGMKDQNSKEAEEQGQRLAETMRRLKVIRTEDIDLTKIQLSAQEKELIQKEKRLKVLEKAGVLSKSEVKDREKLAEMDAVSKGLKQELAYWVEKLNQLGEDDAILTTKQKLEKAKLKAEIKGVTEAIKDESDARETASEKAIRDMMTERNQQEEFALFQFDAGTKKFKDYWNFLEIRKTQIAEEIEDEQKKAMMIEGIDKQQENLAFERFGRLRMGFKEFLKGELIDYITAKQIQLIGDLAKIWSTGASTLGTSLAVSLPLYGVGIALLEGAKAKVQAFADGGLVEKATLGLVGEAGPEVIAPQKGFQDYATKELTPMIMSQIQLGNVAGGPDMAKMERSLNELVNIVKGGEGRTILRGSDIVIAENRFKRGRM